MTVPPGTCPACGEPAVRGQEYCLECGSRIAAPGTRRVHWAWPSLAALLVAVAGGAVAIAAGSGGGSPETIVAIGPLRHASRPQVNESMPRAAKALGLVPWRRADGWTVVVGSVPTGRGTTPAVALARRAVRSGLRPVGILDSSLYASLHPGYRVVFAGVYATQEDAEAALPKAESRFRSANVRRIVR